MRESSCTLARGAWDILLADDAQLAELEERDVTRPVFLLGPPGAGKTTLGHVAAERLSRRLDMLENGSAPLERIDALLAAGATLIEVPWELQLDAPLLRRLRERGKLVALWAHPAEMQARAARPYELHPRRGLTTKGGFGRRGTSCVEHRALDRACDEVLLLDGLCAQDAAEELAGVLEELADEPSDDGLAEHLADLWLADASADRRAAKVLAEAMARHIAAARDSGASARALRAMESDLHVAGLLFFMYQKTKPSSVLRDFACTGPNLFDLRRKFFDSPSLVSRYSRTWRAFARAHGDLEEDD